jgi:hypothetical protein
MENFKEVFEEFRKTKEPEDLDRILKEKLGIGFAECQQALCDSLQERAEEMSQDMTTMAPHGDYGKLMEDAESIAKFLREEASKPEHWKIEFIELRKESDQLMEMIFFNKAVDDGDLLKGFVFVGLSGKIRHAFAQVNS